MIRGSISLFGFKHETTHFTVSQLGVVVMPASFVRGKRTAKTNQRYSTSTYMPCDFTRAPPPQAPAFENDQEIPSKSKELLQVGTNLISRYNITGRLSKGTFGFVYSGEDTFTKKAVALKAMTARHTNIAIREKSSLMLLNKEENKYVARLLDFIILDKSAVGKVCKYVLVLPKYEKNLYEQIKSVREEEGDEAGLSVRTQELVLSDVLNGLKFIHKSGIMHLDLKPENIMYNKVNLRPVWTIIDFGNAEPKSGLDVYYDAVTPWYRAPEICVGAKFYETADIWSIGCLIYEIQVGMPLFDGFSNLKLIEKHFIELGAPPVEFLRLPLQPHINTMRHILVGRQGGVRYTIMRRSESTKPKSTIGKAVRLKDYMYSCLRWLPSERPSAKVLFAQLEQEVAEGRVGS